MGGGYDWKVLYTVLMEVDNDMHPLVVPVCKVQVYPFVHKGPVNSYQQTFRAHWACSIRIFLINTV